MEDQLQQHATGSDSPAVCCMTVHVQSQYQVCFVQEMHETSLFFDLLQVTGWNGVVSQGPKSSVDAINS